MMPVTEANPGIINSVLADAQENNIPTIGVVDTNVNSSIISYPIPSNDDHIDPLQYIASNLSKAIIKGKDTRAMVNKAFSAHYAEAPGNPGF